jgi:hypothetical protein
VRVFAAGADLELSETERREAVCADLELSETERREAVSPPLEPRDVSGIGLLDGEEEFTFLAASENTSISDLCLLHLRDIAISANAAVAKIAAPAFLETCASSLRRHAARLDAAASRRGTGDSDAAAVSASGARFAALLLTSVFARETHPSYLFGGFFFRKETTATVLADAATPEVEGALRAALEACAESSGRAVGEAASNATAAMDRFFAGM